MLLVYRGYPYKYIPTTLKETLTKDKDLYNVFKEFPVVPSWCPKDKDG